MLSSLGATDHFQQPLDHGLDLPFEDFFELDGGSIHSGASLRAMTDFGRGFAMPSGGDGWARSWAIDMNPSEARI